MTNRNLSNQVYELLAQQLAAEQAEVIKHEAIVESIKQSILNKKLDVIQRVIGGKLFRHEGKRFIVLYESAYDTESGISVIMSFCEDPDDYLDGAGGLTKKEIDLLGKYKVAFSHCIWNQDADWRIELFGASNQLARLKNDIRLIKTMFWEFSYDEACDPEFFKRSGITLGTATGVGCKRIMLEDTIIKQDRY